MNELLCEEFDDSFKLIEFVKKHFINREDIQQITETINDNFNQNYTLFYWKGLKHNV